MRRLTCFYTLGLATAAAALLGFAELAEDVLAGNTQATNLAVLRFLHAHATPALDRLALALTRAAGIAGTAAAGVLVVSAFLWRRRVVEAATVTLVLLGGTALVVVLKHAFRQPRPDLFESLAPEHTFSFPSGHALISVCLYGTLAAMLVLERPKAGWRWLAAAGLILLAVGIGWSRLYLGVHWLSDVAAGGLAAVFWVACCLLARHYVRTRLAGRSD